MPELAEKINEVSDALIHLRFMETGLEEGRLRFRLAIEAAHEAGASYAMLGKLVGLSRQRVARIADGGEFEKR